jgi:hypothetical protein
MFGARQLFAHPQKNFIECDEDLAQVRNFSSQGLQTIYTSAKSNTLESANFHLTYADRNAHNLISLVKSRDTSTRRGHSDEKVDARCFRYHAAPAQAWPAVHQALNKRSRSPSPRCGDG